jgi:hypothetical protein
VKLEEPSAEYGYTEMVLMGVSGRVGAVRKSAWRQKNKVLQIIVLNSSIAMIIRSFSACTGRFTFGVIPNLVTVEL